VKLSLDVIKQDARIRASHLADDLVIEPVLILVGGVSIGQGRLVASRGMVGVQKDRPAAKVTGALDDLAQVGLKRRHADARMAAVAGPDVTVIHPQLDQQHIGALALDFVGHVLQGLPRGAAVNRGVDHRHAGGVAFGQLAKPRGNPGHPALVDGDALAVANGVAKKDDVHDA